MKALFKVMIATMMAIALVGCGSMTGAAVGAHYGGPGGAAVGAGVGSVWDSQVGYQNGRRPQAGYPSAGGGLRAAPCEPFRAEGLMAWATELEGTSHQKRVAKVSNDNGRINCHSSETAGSQGGTAVRRSPQSAARPAVGTDRYPAATVYEMR